MTSRADKKQQTRQKLIFSALQLSAEKGFSATSLREIATNAGITPAAFYNHFDDLEDLGLSLIDELAISLRRLLRNARKNSTKQAAEITKFSIKIFLSYIKENTHHFKLLLGERQGASASFRLAIRTEMDRFVAELAEDIEKIAALRGEALRNSGLAAEAIVAVVFTIGAEALDLPPHKHAGLEQRLIEEVNMIMRGARL